ncbi:MAG: 4Fe-4S dicluster domain-containing protein [Dehalococcoidia bacterium]|nr:4Fe-4S dicluster domain-containing protein [Dehalococcoidia bacterium]
MKTKVPGENDFLNDICSLPGGEDIRLCIQCGTCSASCPNASKMEFAPRELIAMARAGLRKEVLTSNSMWLCASCYLCTVRCPRGIKPTNLMHALESLAARDGLSSPRSLTPSMYRSFSDFVYSIGSVPEVGFMTWFYFLTNPLRAVKMLPLVYKLLTHGRLTIKARRMKPEAEQQLKAILDRAETLGGV